MWTKTFVVNKVTQIYKKIFSFDSDKEWVSYGEEIVENNKQFQGVIYTTCSLLKEELSQECWKQIAA